MKKKMIFFAAAAFLTAAVLMTGGCSGSFGGQEQLKSDMESAQQSGEPDALQDEETDAQQSGEPDALQDEETDARQSGEPDAPQDEETDAQQSGEPDALRDEETDAQQNGEPDARQDGNAESDGAAEQEVPPLEIEEDWSAYFDGLNGCAVLYEPSKRQYRIYEPELAATRRSPCSTFKIVSSLIALESAVILPEQSARTWSGEIFWNESWNHDQTFEEAFRASCVWYFREVIDEIGAERMQEELDRLGYGNCDISDWEGRLNTNNNNRSLTGFWIESSLAISPKEQTEVMERIFGNGSVYSEETRSGLRRVMLTEQDDQDVVIYGKTGMGKAHGIVVDAWFTGFAEKEDEMIYFCIYLGRTDGRDVSSAAAREIAVSILSEEGSLETEH